MNIQKTGFNMHSKARGYIASGEFNGNRAPQHLQNLIVKLYCDNNDLEFILSRAEYWINGSTKCQLWAGLKEGFKNIVFYSLWQLPVDRQERHMIYKYCIENSIVLHFASELIQAESDEVSFSDLEILIQSNSIMNQVTVHSEHFANLKEMI